MPLCNKNAVSIVVNLYHIYNQEIINRMFLNKKKEYNFFLWLIRKNLLPFSELLAYCLMPNHFHLMIYADENDVMDPY